MKRSIAILLAAVLMLTMALSLSACGSSDNKTEDKATEAQKAGAFTVDDTTFTYKGASVALDSKAADAIAALGEADEVKSELSCHGEGDDKTYTYPDFTLKTYPKDGEDRVLEILVNKAGVATSKGIGVGSTVEEVTQAYGSDYKQIAKFYVFDAGSGKTLRFAIENNAVVQIDYYFNV